jgi:hypothetical protein
VTRSRQDGSMLGLAAAATLALAAAALGRPRGGSRSTEGADTPSGPITLATMKSKPFRFADYRRDPLGALDFLDRLKRRVAEAEGRGHGYAYEVPFRFPHDPFIQSPYWFQDHYPSAIQPFIQHKLNGELERIQKKMQDESDPIHQDWFTEGASILFNPNIPGGNGRVMLLDHNLSPDKYQNLALALNRHGLFTISTPLGIKRIGPTDEQLRPLESHINRLILSLEQRERLALYIQEWADDFSEKLFDEELWTQYLIKGHWATRDEIEDLISAGIR